jgi:hypothetical protein
MGTVGEDMAPADILEIMVTISMVVGRPIILLTTDSIKGNMGSTLLGVSYRNLKVYLFITQT